MNILICELCKHEVKINLNGKKITEVVCPVCHRNGKTEDGLWVPSLVEKMTYKEVCSE